jgi:AraC-like DNA-binding protein
MATEQQVNALTNQGNREARESIRTRIRNYFEEHNCSLTVYELADKIGLSYKQLQPRISELSSSRFLIEYGSRDDNTVYKLNRDINKSHKATRTELLKSVIKKSVGLEVYNAIIEEFERELKCNC